jgi:3-deoxy-D-manno-octulosonate 8-phosphate phosphatase (KDO 8-P phosphatase)
LRKLEVFEEILRNRNLAVSETAYMGDDVVDVPLLRRAGFGASVADGVEEARRAAAYVTSRPGGRGAVREVCELILRGQGRWAEVTARYELV